MTSSAPPDWVGASTTTSDTAGRMACRRIAQHLGAVELYVIDHGFEELSPVLNDGRSIPITADMISSFCSGQAIDHRNERLVPFLNGSFPVLIAKVETGGGGDAVGWPVGEWFASLMNRYEFIEKRRRRESMSAAGQMQWDELQTRALDVGEFRVGGTLVPAYDVAGDLFDLAVQPDGSIGVLSLDAMGRGVTAGLSAVLAISTIRSVRREGGDIAEQMRAADAMISLEYEGSRFVTGVALSIDGNGIDVVNAGHEPLRRYGLHGIETEWVDADPPLGVEGPTPYRKQRIDPLRSDEILAVLTDGVSGVGRRGEPDYSDARIASVLDAHGHEPPVSIAHHLARSVIEHSGGELGDDATVVLVKAS